MPDTLTAGGSDVSDFSARSLTAAAVQEAGLVLAMAREHRWAVVELWPAAVRRTFTLRELARLAQAVDPAALEDRAGAGSRRPARELSHPAAALSAAARPGGRRPPPGGAWA